jgi:hypothetical protein
MNKGEEPLRIIGNESNQVFEIEPGSSTPGPEETTPKIEDKPIGPPSWNVPSEAAPQSSNDLATNDGGVIETLDSAFHNKPGEVERTALEGSNRADYFEAYPNGKSDAEEEVNPSSAQ